MEDSAEVTGKLARLQAIFLDFGNGFGRLEKAGQLWGYVTQLPKLSFLVYKQIGGNADRSL